MTDEASAHLEQPLLGAPARARGPWPSWPQYYLRGVRDGKQDDCSYCDDLRGLHAQLCLRFGEPAARQRPDSRRAPWRDPLAAAGQLGSSITEMEQHVSGLILALDSEQPRRKAQDRSGRPLSP